MDIKTLTRTSALGLAVLMAAACAGQNNTLTDKEKAEGW